jgi:hypothetical protein
LKSLRRFLKIIANILAMLHTIRSKHKYGIIYPYSKNEKWKTTMQNFYNRVTGIP